MPETRLTRTIGLLYQMESDDSRRLSEQLLDARKRAWVNGLRDVAKEHGCNGTPNAPRLADLRELREMSREDAHNIAKTYNNDVQREIERLYDANPRGNRNYYFKNLEEWSQKRDNWKLDQIALNTETTTRQYARERFYSVNNLRGGKVRLVGPVPVCKICTRLVGLGFVDQSVADANAAPLHIGCPHEWQQVKPRKVDCGDLWLG